MLGLIFGEFAFLLRKLGFQFVDLFLVLAPQVFGLFIAGGLGGLSRLLRKFFF